jgi:hypothetical protein
MKLEVAREQEVPREDAVDMPVWQPRKRRRDRRHLAAVCRQKKEQDQNLDARRRRKEQKWAQKKDGCWRNLVAARRGTTRRVQVARRNFSSTKDTTREYCGSRKGLVAALRRATRHAKVARRTANSIGKIRTRGDMVRRTSERRTFGRKCQPTRKATMDLGGNRPLYPKKRKTAGMDIGGWSLGQLSSLERGGPTYGILKKPAEREMAKQTAGSPVRWSNIEQWTSWRGRPPPKRKKERSKKSRIWGGTGRSRSYHPHWYESVCMRDRANVKNNCRGCQESRLTSTLPRSCSGRAGLRTGRM